MTQGLRNDTGPCVKRSCRRPTPSRFQRPYPGLSEMLSMPCSTSHLREVRVVGRDPDRRCRNSDRACLHAAMAIDSIALTAPSRSSNVVKRSVHRNRGPRRA